MGAVETTSKSLEAIMLGRSLEPRRVRTLARYLSGKGRLTPNQKYMAAAAGLHIPSLRAAAEDLADKMLAREETEGPRPWELFPPDPHGGMYDLGTVAMVASGGEIGSRAAVILGQVLRLADQVAAPDGDCRGLPGGRAAAGAGLNRRSLSQMLIEARRRQLGGEHLVHRGTGGRARALKYEADSDALIDGPAWWLRIILDDLGGPSLLHGHLAPWAALPPRMRLPLTIYRWDGGTLAFFADPGTPEERRPFITTGSKQGTEKPVSWIEVTHGKPAKHRARAGICWEIPPPEPPAGARKTFIEGGG